MSNSQNTTWNWTAVGAIAALIGALVPLILHFLGQNEETKQKVVSAPLHRSQPSCPDFEVNYVYRPGGKGPLEPLTEGAILESGDHYKIQFTPREDSFVYIFQIDASGEIFQLFPMRSFKGVAVDNQNPVEAGTAYVLPAPDKAFRLDDRVGTESIYFLASRDAIEELENGYEALTQARQENDSTLADELQAQLANSLISRGLADIVPDPDETIAKVPWLEDILPVAGRRLDDLCDHEAGRITFEHR